MTPKKPVIAVILAIAIAAPIAGFLGDMKGQPMTFIGVRIPFFQRLPIGQFAQQNELSSLDRAKEWFNSPPLTAKELRGKVVLIDFWTFTCINWLRTLPYVRAWAEKYKDQGLVVVGVHAPEFSFEKDLRNVLWAVKNMRINYPIVVDNNHAIWRAFRNHAWPALYFIDAQGRLRHHHLGEGSYEHSEAIIQNLLIEAGNSRGDGSTVVVHSRGTEVPADWSSLKSPETYVGYHRTQNFASPGGPHLNELRTYELPARLRRNSWALHGRWNIESEGTVLDEPNGRIAYSFHARDLHLVMGPKVRGNSVRFRILIDGKSPGAAHGTDVDDQGNGVVYEQRLYQLIRQSGTVSNRHFEIYFFDPGVEVFAFTFG